MKKAAEMGVVLRGQRNQCAACGELFNLSVVSVRIDDPRIQQFDAALAAIMTEKLWAIHVGGCDDIYAAPSEAVAIKMAERENKLLMADEKIQASLSRIGLKFDAVKVSVIRWPFDPAWHAKEIENFDYGKWGLERD